MGTQGGKSSRGGEVLTQKTVGWSTRFWLDFWKQADELKDCYVWRGELDRAGHPVFALKGTPRKARQLAWLWVGNPPELGVALKPNCRRKDCIRPEHQVAR